MMTWLRSRWAQNLLVVLMGVIGVYSLVLIDVVSRAKESYAQAETYMEWSRNPEKKKQFFEKKFETSKAKLDKMLSEKKIPDDAYKEKLESLVFDRDFSINESSLKYAYQYYKDTYELFSPPESKWVKLARVKTPETLELWKQELRAQNIPFEDTMFE